VKSSIVLKIGGSVIYDNSLNVNQDLLDKLKDWYFRKKDDYQNIVIVVGGGSLSRDLQEKISRHIGGQEYLHSIGMSVTHTNANLLRAYIGDPEIVVPQRLGEAYELLMDSGKSIMVCGGLKVGWSTDMDAAVFADILNESRITKISNIDYIYDKDPSIVEDATPMKDMTWNEYFKIFNIQEDSTHTPNGNIPIDVECARFCKRKEISFWISGGNRIKQASVFEDIMTEGTLVHP
jgi:predicted uridylate kinase